MSLRSTCVLVLILSLSAGAYADNQTPTVSPVHVGSSYPYQISLQTYDFGSALLPTLQSFAAGTYEGKWVLLAGRTNGMHGFGQTGQQNFPPASQNKDIWVIDPVTKQSWRRALTDDATITPLQLAELSSANTQFAQVGNTLYITGGYGNGPAPSGFQTYTNLSAINLQSLSQWVVNGTGSASASIRQIRDSAFQVTGGAMFARNGRMHLVMGQTFTGGYPNGTGVYTQQVRSFDIVDDGVNLGTASFSATTPDPAYRRRDLNVVNTVRPGLGNSLEFGYEALSGVFTETDGAWTVPVQIDGNGQPSMANPNLPGTFKQAMNNYHSAKLGLYSQQYGQMHQVLFGGITLQYYDDATQSFVQDNEMPFTNQITQVNVEADGTHSQDLLGTFPPILDQQGNLMRFGAGAEFFLADGIPTYDNGVIKLDELPGPTVLGYVFGGIFSNAPHTRGVPGAVSGASNQIFEVIYTPVPEPGVLGACLLLSVALLRRCR